MTRVASRRKKFLVERQVQGASGVRIAGHWLLFLISTIVMTTALRVIGNIDHASFGEMFATALREQAVSIVVLLALLPWFVHDALVLSSRFAGPMIRLRGAMRELCEVEEPTPLKFRKGDFWGEMATEFNQVQTRMKEVRAELRDLKRQQEQMLSRSQTVVPGLDVTLALPTAQPTA